MQASNMAMARDLHFFNEVRKTEGDMDKVDPLLESYCKTSADRSRLLRSAVKVGCGDLIDFFIDDTTINGELEGFEQPLSYAYDPFIQKMEPETKETISIGRLECVKKLLAADYDLAKVDERGWNAFHKAAFEGNADIMQILLDHPSAKGRMEALRATTSSVPCLGRCRIRFKTISPFNMTVLYGHVACAKLMFEKYAKGRYEGLGLYAVQSGNTDMLDLLLEYDIALKESYLGRHGKGLTLLHLAIQHGAEPYMVMHIVEAFPGMANTVYPATRKRPIDCAELGYIEELEEVPGLLEKLGYKAPKPKTEVRAETPTELGLLSVIEKKDEANLEAAVRRANVIERKEAAIKAAKSGWLTALNVLYEIGRKLDLREAKGSPIDIAREHGHTEVLEWLLALQRANTAVLGVADIAPPSSTFVEPEPETYYQIEQQAHIQHLRSSLSDWRRDADALKKSIEPHIDGRSKQFRFSEAEIAQSLPADLSQQIKDMLDHIKSLRKGFSVAKLDLSFDPAKLESAFSHYLELLQNPAAFLVLRPRSGSGRSSTDLLRERSYSRTSEPEERRGGAASSSSSARSPSPLIGHTPPLLAVTDTSPPRIALVAGASLLSGIAVARPRAELGVADECVASIRQALQRLEETFSKPECNQNRAVLWLNQVRLFRLLAKAQGKKEYGYSQLDKANRIGNHLVHQHATALLGNKIYETAYELTHIRLSSGSSNLNIFKDLNDWVAGKRYFEITNADPGPAGPIDSNSYYQDRRTAAELFTSLKEWVLPAFAQFEKEVNKTGSIVSAASDIDLYENLQATLLMWRELVQRSVSSRELRSRLGWDWTAEFWKEIGGFCGMIAHDHETSEPLSAAESALIGMVFITRDAVHPKDLWAAVEKYLPKFKILAPELFALDSARTYATAGLSQVSAVDKPLGLGFVHP